MIDGKTRDEMLADLRLMEQVLHSLYRKAPSDMCKVGGNLQQLEVSMRRLENEIKQKAEEK